MQAGLDLTGLSIIANEDDWRWNSATMDFYYVGGNALVSVGPSDAVGALGSAAKDVAGSKSAQRGIKRFLIDLGASTTMKEISVFAQGVKKGAAVINVALAAHDAVNRFNSCRN